MDESFLGMSNYARRKWQVLGKCSSESVKPVMPRVTLIGAIDNYGEAYVSILQANTNADVIQLFLLELIEILNKKYKHWRTNSMIIIDNAAYHTSASTLKMLQE